jgi:hypothetical protein
VYVVCEPAKGPREKPHQRVPAVSAAREVVGVGAKFMSLQIRGDVGAVTCHYQSVPGGGTPQLVRRLNHGIAAAE